MKLKIILKMINLKEYKESCETHELAPDEIHMQSLKKQDTMRRLDYNPNSKFVLTTSRTLKPAVINV